jgi:hypothetical protein
MRGVRVSEPQGFFARVAVPVTVAVPFQRQHVPKMSSPCYLATFRPLVQRSAGRRAVQRYGLPPFIDGSCRREPDFESRYPSISATCRAGHFAPRLTVGDRIAYLTVKGRWLNCAEPHRRLIAVLRVFTDSTHIERPLDGMPIKICHSQATV